MTTTVSDYDTDAITMSTSLFTATMTTGKEIAVRTCPIHVFFPEQLSTDDSPPSPSTSEMETPAGADDYESSVFQLENIGEAC